MDSLVSRVGTTLVALEVGPGSNRGLTHFSVE